MKPRYFFSILRKKLSLFWVSGTHTLGTFCIVSSLIIFSLSLLIFNIEFFFRPVWIYTECNGIIVGDLLKKQTNKFNSFGTNDNVILIWWFFSFVFFCAIFFFFQPPIFFSFIDSFYVCGDSLSVCVQCNLTCLNKTVLS